MKNTVEQINDFISAAAITRTTWGRGWAFFPLKLILPVASTCPFCESTTFGFSVAQDSGETSFLCIWSPNATWISGSE